MTTAKAPRSTNLTNAQHRFTHGTILDAPLRLMLKNETTDILYSSPPWDDAKVRQYSHNRLDWPRFFDLLTSLIHNHVDGWVFLEIGLHTSDQGAERLSEVCKDVHVFATSYGTRANPTPSRLLVGNTNQSAAGWRPHKLWLQGRLAQPLGCIGSIAKPGQVLLDPACTNVYTAQSARRLGLVFYGSDHNALRAQAIQRILALP